MSLSSDELAQVQRYLDELAPYLRRLPAAARNELLQELRGHLSDSALSRSGDRMTQAIAALGPPQAYADALVGDWLLDSGSRGFHPLPLAEGLLRSSGRGLARMLLGALFALGYLGLLLIGFAVLAKLFYPDLGLWLHPDGDVSLGWVEPGTSTELLGGWLVPLGLLLVVAGWWLLNRLLRLLLRLA